MFQTRHLKNPLPKFTRYRERSTIPILHLEWRDGGAGGNGTVLTRIASDDVQGNISDKMDSRNSRRRSKRAGRKSC